METIRLTMAQALVRFLENQYIDVDGQESRFVRGVFIIPGHGNVVGFGQALTQEAKELEIYQGKNEQGMAQAAVAFAKQMKRKQIFAVTSSVGPGAANMVTACGTATANNIPVLVLPGDTYACRQPDPVLQQVEHTNSLATTTNDAFKAVCRYWDRIVRPEQLMSAAISAFRTLTDPANTGAVCLAMPQDVEGEAYDYPVSFFKKRVWRLERRPATEAALQEAAEAIRASKKPMLICGGGVVRGRAHNEFRTFAEKLDAPVAITVMGGGGFPGGHPLTTGMIGMHGSQASNVACNECDLLIAVGCRFSDRVALQPDTFASQAKIVHIDIDRSEIDKNVLTDHHIVGSAKRVLALLNQRLPQYSHPDWKERILPLREPSVPRQSESLTPKQVLETIRRLAPQDSIVATDVGQHQMWSIQHFHFDYPGQLLTSGGFGTMGFGLGAAIGAKVGNPDKVVVHTTGDGCFRMNCHELATVEHYHLPIITVVFNNGTLGMVRQWQNLIYSKRFSETTLDRGPDFVKLAEAYGLAGFRATTMAEMEEAFHQALEAGRGCVIDCVLDMDEMVRPMVAGGAHITDFLLK